jgi:pimeloyl-ACP methyl ester carboxylesterase
MTMALSETSSLLTAASCCGPSGRADLTAATLPANPEGPEMATVHHRYAAVNGQRLFYREAGPGGAPAVVLLHGFPSSSFMFRHLILQLADRHHVIAPDHLGFGLSDAPPTDGFGYTFDGAPVLAVWGRNEEIFRPEGALAFAQDAPDAEICLLDGGHFLLESHLEAAAGHIRDFPERTHS